MQVALDNTVIIEDIKLASKSGTANNSSSNNKKQDGGDDSESNGKEDWRPLLLFIPLRLGLTDINELYIPDLKVLLAV